MLDFQAVFKILAGAVLPQCPSEGILIVEDFGLFDCALGEGHLLLFRFLGYFGLCLCFTLGTADRAVYNPFTMLTPDVVHHM